MKPMTSFKKSLAFLGRGFERHPWIGLFMLAILPAGILMIAILPDATSVDQPAGLIVKQAAPQVNQNLRYSLVGQFKSRQDSALPERPSVSPF